MHFKLTYPTPLHSGQQDLWDQFIGNDEIVEASVNCGRRWGKTIFGKRCGVHWLFQPNDPVEVGWIAPETSNFTKVFRWFQSRFEKVIEKASAKDYYIKFKNGSELSFWSVKNHQAIRGQGFDYAILDEYAWGYFSDPDAIDSYEPALTECRKILKISTPAGKNVHYNDFQRAQLAINKIAYKAPSSSNPHLNKEYLAEKQRVLPQSRWAQEYLGEFLEGGGEVFTDLNSVCSINQYDLPNSNHRYVYAIDWASKNDQSVLTIINLDTSTVDMIVSNYSNSYPEITSEFVKVLNRYNIVGGYVELNGVGMAQFDYFRQAFPLVEGFTMSQGSKEEIVTLLRTRIQEREITLPSEELCPELYQQLSDYECKTSLNGRYSYSHPKGKHDDYVDSLMIASLAMRDYGSGMNIAINPWETTFYDPDDLFDDVDERGNLI